MNVEAVYLTQDIVDTYVAVIASAGIIGMIAVGSMLIDSWWKERKNGS